MSCFKIPGNVIDDLNSMIGRFWWGKAGGRRGIHWAKWMDVCTSKMQSEMGFRDFAYFNDALLAKQCWRLVQYPASLVHSILQCKCFPNGSFLEANLGRNPSFIWRSFCSARTLLQEGLRWRVGDGQPFSKGFVCQTIGCLNLSPLGCL